MGQTSQLAAPRTGLRTDQLQFLRFLAFLNVFMVHCVQWKFYSYPDFFGAKSAVSFFFLLSGLLTGYNGFGREVRLGLRDQGRYMWKKLRKAYPLYCLTNLYMVLVNSVPELVFTGDDSAALPEIKQLLKNLLFLQPWYPEGAFSFNGASWFLAALMFLYLFNLPGTWLLNRIGKREKGKWILGGAMAGLGLLAAGWCWCTRGMDMEFVQYLFPPARLWEYLMAMILGWLIRSWEPKLAGGEGRKKTALCTGLEVAALAGWILSLHFPGPLWTRESLWWLIPNLTLLAVFTWGGGWVSRLFRRRPLVALGDISFECYLIHLTVILPFYYSNTIPEDSLAGKVFSYIFCFLVTLGAAMLAHKPKKRT